MPCPAFLCKGGRKGLWVTKRQNKLSARPFLRIHSSLLSVKWFHHQVLSTPREGRTRLQVSHRVTVYSCTDHRYPTFRLNCSFFQKTFTELHLQYTSVSHVPSARKVMKARLNPKAHPFLSLQFPHPRAWQAWPSATQEALWLWQHQVLKPPSTNYSNSRGMHEFPQPSLKHKLRLSELVTETLKKQKTI